MTETRRECLKTVDPTFPALVQAGGGSGPLGSGAVGVSFNRSPTHARHRGRTGGGVHGLGHHIRRRRRTTAKI